ncbi:MAG: TerD family protein [Alphaproteobacteria bacterium]|nr:TerD family protein [Alphaproteobacteria bacterium]
MPLGPAKGEKTPLLHTLAKRQRVLATLNWDPRRGKIGLFDKLKGNNQQYDLDIICLMFGQDGTFLDYVSAEAQYAIDQTGKIYHSGDDQTGEGDTDDEYITTELAELPAVLNHIVYVVEVKSNHTFGDLDTIVRIVDSFSHNVLLETDVGVENAYRDTKAFVFAALSRDPASPTGWTLFHIGDYPPLSEVSDWGTYLRRYLT